ncbi:hypothetical protein F8154_13960 [Alkaliphilus pronyensis]|uniref:GerAB/ArcD/ProY family transporter n=1 Tax=Alkaliphilus pronyensis TaxID=1482732 RepID=A0A6I0F7S5_9FIRM|nr:hypothetical protein [Alkaliphilus pronyensis]KAB3530293.1 hypothetical protein F8154_13960 [Alkaliphilus pronyensis]
MKRVKSVWTIASIYVGTVIGAGFASGQEILLFFGLYNGYGVIGVIFATILFCGVGVLILDKVYSKNIMSFEDFILCYLNGRLIKLIQVIVTFFLVGSYVIMITGSGTILKEHFQYNPLKGIILMSLLCFFVFNYGTKGIARVNEIIVPIMLVIVIFVTVTIVIRFINHLDWRTIVNESNKLLLSFRNTSIIDIIALIIQVLWKGLIYVSYNTLITIVVISTIRPLILDRKSAVMGGAFGGVMLGLLAFLILSSLLIFWSNIYKLEIPMIAIASSLGENIKKAYSLLLLLAMFTTAIAAGHGGIMNICQLIKSPKPVVSAMICIFAIPLTLIGFKSLISVTYPFFGYLGFGFLALIILNPSSNK